VTPVPAPEPAARPIPPGGPAASFWPRLLLGLSAAYLLFEGSARTLGSDRGQAGLLVGAGVVAAVLGAERLLFGRPVRAAARELGLGRPGGRGLLAALGVCALLLLVVPVFVGATGAPAGVYPGWGWLLPGLFAQAGIAEEVLFRGYLFRHVRRGRPFWRAAGLAAVPFVAVHLTMFLALPWPIALAGVLLAVTMSFPLAYLFELGGDTVWAPALVHFVMQGAVKVVVIGGEPAAVFPLVWMAAGAALPYLAFLIARDPRAEAAAGRS
jgi:membrane protease YdiL (CAAX protease family)